MEQRFETFTMLINRISRNIRKIKIQEMADHDLRSAHISCLYYLYSSPGLTATDLCEKCEEDKATISRALDYLEANEYLSCESKQAKRYKASLTLTEKGVAVSKQIADKVNAVLDEISIGLTEDERITFYRSLSIISNHLESIAQKHKQSERISVDENQNHCRLHSRSASGVEETSTHRTPDCPFWSGGVY